MTRYDVVWRNTLERNKAASITNDSMNNNCSTAFSCVIDKKKHFRLSIISQKYEYNHFFKMRI